MSNQPAPAEAGGLQRPLDAPRASVIRVGAPQPRDPVAGLTGNEIADLQRRVEILERYVANLQRGRVVPL